MSSGDTRHQDDLALAAEVLTGSTEAWHRFVDRYGGVVYATVRQYLFDDEDRRDAWTDVMARLYEGSLEGYEGRSALSTWLVIVARSAACDLLRARRGRRSEPPAVAALGDRERHVFQRLYQDGISPEELRHEMIESGRMKAGESVARIVDTVDSALGGSTLRRIAWDLQARSVGAVSGRMLEYLDTLVDQQREKATAMSPEQRLHESHVRETLARVDDLVERLPAGDREILNLRYRSGWTAQRIANELEIDGQREVYTSVDRSIRTLRRWLGVSAVLAFSIISGISASFPTF